MQPLWMILFMQLFEELVIRAGKLRLGQSDDALVQGLKGKNIFDAEGRWNLLQWGSQREFLRPPIKAALTIDEGNKMIHRVQLGGTPALIQRIATMRNMPGAARRQWRFHGASISPYEIRRPQNFSTY